MESCMESARTSSEPELAPHRAAQNVCTALHVVLGAFSRGHYQTIPTSAPALHAVRAT